MKLEIDSSDIQKVAAPYPIGFVDNFLNYDDCKKIFDEISLINNYDDKNFPVDVFQTGSGTSTNMNVNEVIARVAKIKFKTEVHPNDDINKCQSSNDVIPTCISYFSVKSLNSLLIPEIENLINSIKIKANKYDNVVKTGRTHLMDAMPITLKQELSAWATQIINTELEIKKAIKRLSFLPIGGTAIGSGINSHPNYSKEFIKFISTKKNSFFEKKDNLIDFQNDEPKN